MALDVTKGGTGSQSFPSGEILVGNGEGPVTTIPVPGDTAAQIIGGSCVNLNPGDDGNTQAFGLTDGLHPNISQLFIASVAGAVKNLYVEYESPGDGESVTVQVDVNGDRRLSVLGNDPGGGTVTDLVHIVPVAQGTEVAMAIMNTAGSTTTMVCWGFAFIAS